jgi:SWIM/SEC-C metal-binding protein
LDKVFDGKKPARLGTEKQPARLSVKTERRKKDLESVFEQNGWACEIEVDPDAPENTMDLERLQNPVATIKVEQKAGRNDPCPCGSGKKFKKCCGK